MSSYTAPLMWRRIDDRFGFTLTPFEFWCELDGVRYTVHVPAGTVFNGASIPRPIQLVFGWDPFDPKWLKAAIVHDSLVAECGYQAQLITDDGIAITPDWFLSATVFSEALRVKQDQHQCPEFNRRAFVGAVRFWGYVTHARTTEHALGPRRQ